MNNKSKKKRIKEQYNKISAIVLIGGKIDIGLLDKCLNSLNWCDEIVRVDTNKVPGSFSEWRNYGAEKAKGDWIIYIDSDEEVSEDLRNEILKTVKNPKFPAYAIPRKNIVLGKELKHGGFGSYDYVKRLFDKKYFNEWKGELHEEPYFYFGNMLTSGKKSSLGFLQNKIIHIKAQDIEDMVEKTNTWSEIEAKLMDNAKHPNMNLMRFTTAAAREFYFRFIKHKSYKDGDVGVIHGLYQVWSRLMSYLKLWELQLKDTG